MVECRRNLLDDFQKPPVHLFAITALSAPNRTPFLIAVHILYLPIDVSHEVGVAVAGAYGFEAGNEVWTVPECVTHALKLAPRYMSI